ncbi:MAG TPA: IS4 family transposase [Steroidobacteraceae bacterium]
MPSYDPPSHCPEFDRTLAPFLTDAGLPFAQVLSADAVAQAFAAEDVTFGTAAHTIFTPALTLWAFLSQVIDDAKSCGAAVLRVAVLLVALGREPCAEDTAAYCRARAQLPGVVIRRLALDVGRNLEQEVPTDWLWKGKHVQLIDGTTVTAPDTPANQKAYPQSPSQKRGLGFPIIRLVVLLSLATAALLGMAAAPYQGKETGETALARPLLEDLSAGDILLADRFYCTYWLVALARTRGVDVVLRMHHRRAYDFRRGQRLGRKDHVVVWQRPARPAWMDAATYATVPETLTVRELHVAITAPGCRTRSLVVVTTLTDAVVYSKEDIADLYHQRWHVELDIRAIKQSLHMDHLRCRTPEMVTKELWAHFLGYNLVRKVSAQAALTQGIHPRAVSFTATKQAVAAWWSQATLAPTAAERVRQGKLVLLILGTKPVGDRPDRYEPRAVKRRPKEYDRLMKPRAQARAALRRRRGR